MSDTFRLKGWHVLACLLGFFSVIVVANGIFLTYAVRSFPGEQEEKSYLQGLRFNDALAERAAQRALGWSASIDQASRGEGETLIAVRIVDRNGAPVSGLTLEGVLSRPADDDFDQRLAFEDAGGGVYRARGAPVSPGAWILDARAVGARNEAFSLRSELRLQ